MMSYARLLLTVSACTYAVACSVEPPVHRESAGLGSDAATPTVDEVETSDVPAEGWMSSDCSPILPAQDLWQMLGSGSYDLYVVSGLKIEGDEEVQERTGTGVLESRALHVSLSNADLVISVTKSAPDHALLFLEDSRVFYSDTGDVFRERACSAALSVDSEGSLSSRVLAGREHSVLLVVQSTQQLGAVVRQVAVVSGDSVRLADQELPLREIVEAASAIAGR